MVINLVEKEIIMLSIGSQLPAFNLTAVVSNDLKDAFVDLNEKSYQGEWKVLFFWPKDFTFICPTEIVAFNEMYDSFKSRGAQILGISTDSEFVHHAWRTHHQDLSNLKFPMVSDIKRELSESLGVLDQNAGVALRATFIIDPENTIRHVSVNDLAVGRNPAEILRILDGLQNGGLCPCNWEKGQDTLKVA